MTNDDEAARAHGRKVLVWVMLFSGAVALLCCGLAAFAVERFTQ